MNRLCLPLVFAFVYALAHQVHAQPWGQPLREAFQKVVLNQYDLALAKTQAVYIDESSPQVEKKVAEDNLLFAFQQKNKVLAPDGMKTKPYDQVTIVFSVNRQTQSRENVSLDLEIAMKRREPIVSALVEKGGVIIGELHQQDFKIRYPEKPEILSGHAKNFTELPAPGLYRLRITTRDQDWEEWVLVDSFPKRDSWPAFHEVKRLNKNNVSVLTHHPSQSFRGAQAKAIFWTLTASVLNERPNWFQIYDGTLPAKVVIPKLQNTSKPQGIGLSHLLKYKWGNVEVVQALNDYVAVAEAE